jgi:hypothetical protein
MRQQKRSAKEACCRAQGGEGAEARASSPCESSNGGESGCIEKGEVASLHPVVL